MSEDRIISIVFYKIIDRRRFKKVKFDRENTKHQRNIEEVHRLQMNF